MPRSDESKESERRRLNTVARARSADSREVGPLPPVADPERKARGRTDPEYFHRTYFGAKYKLAFGEPHRKAICILADCSELGGQFAFAMMRSGGKTTLAETEVLRALLYGLRRFAAFFAATDKLAKRAVKRLRRQLERNEMLLADFPEVCHLVRALDGQYQRCRGQTLNGVLTRMEISGEDGMVLPTVPGSAASGAIIQAYGLTGALKGLLMDGPDGEPMRPDLVVIDDAQTRESAKSPTQTEERERIILDDVMGLAGPETELAAVFLCTPIFPNDLTERFIDRERHPEWQGVRTRMVEVMPTDTAKLDEYGEFRRQALRDGLGKQPVNDYYMANRAEIEAGCVLAWPERVKKGDVSAVQTALNLFLTNPTGFASEYQCEPERAVGPAEAKRLDPRRVEKRYNGSPRLVAPPGTTRVTASIDLSGTVHWYAVVGWNERFGGGVLDYGTWPRQARRMFTQADAAPSLVTQFPKLTELQRVFAGLESLVPDIMGRVYLGAEKAEFRVDRLLIDAGHWPDAVYDFIRRSPFGGSVYASKGQARSETSAGVARWKRRPGERDGYHWRLTAGSNRGRGRQVQFDADAWKSVVHSALAVELGEPAALTLWGQSAGAHTLIAEHCGAERSEPKALRGEVFDKWTLPTHRPDNHLWDCLVGCAVAASVQGLKLRADGELPRPRAKKAKPKGAPAPHERQQINPKRLGA